MRKPTNKIIVIFTTICFGIGFFTGNRIISRRK